MAKLILRNLRLGFLFASTTWLAMSGCGAPPTDLGPNAWNNQQWAEKVKGLRTSYNPVDDLSSEELTLVPGDERWLDFVYWSFANKLSERQIEAYGGTDGEDPAGGVLFHWAPGSHWETHTLASWGLTIGHLVGEHRWRDTHFPEFFEKYGGVYGANIKDRLAEIDPKSPAPWVEFLDYIAGIDSPYSRYLSHQEHSIDPVNQKIYLTGGHGTGFAYTFERYYHEVGEILTDASAYQFFQMYDLYGPGFASSGNWARQRLAETVAHDFSYVDEEKEEAGAKPGAAGAKRYNPDLPAPEIAADHPWYSEMEAGQQVYNRQCSPCHGIQGDGKGFLAAGLDVKPRDFRPGTYKFRTTQGGEVPTLADIEQTVRVGVPDTSMPAWGQFLNDEEIHQVAVYVTIFSEYFTDAIKSGEEPYKIEMVNQPPDLPRDQLVVEGEKLFQELECWKCHGEQGKGDGPSAGEQEDSWGEPILPADLTYKWHFKNGHKWEDIYRTFIGGLDGTPMPSFLDSLDAYSETDSDPRPRWALVEYILSLSPEERPVVRLKDFKNRIPADLDKFGVVRSPSH